MRRPFLFAAAVLVAVVACSADDDGAATGPTTTAAATTTVGGSTTVPVAQAPTGLTIAPEVGAERYDRDAFGDYDRAGLLAASVAAHGCYLSVADGACHAEPSDVEVDHRVALAEAWASGASEWPAARLDAFGGDPANLALMTAGLNSAKGDSDPAEWLPPDPAAVCSYVERWSAVKAGYGLTADQAEADAIVSAMADC